MREFVFILGFVICVMGVFCFTESVHQTVNTTRIVNTETPGSVRYLTVTVTFYRPDECHWGWLKSTGGYLTPNWSAAVDPKIIPYGTYIYIPEFTVLRAEDTGSAVKKKTASIRRAKALLEDHKIDLSEYREISNRPVIDIFVPTKQEYDRLCKSTPPFVTATLR